jgi:subtilisin family serine protease
MLTRRRAFLSVASLFTAASLLPTAITVTSPAAAQGRPSGASIVRLLGPHADIALAPPSKQFGALVRIPNGASAASFGLEPVTPGIGRLRGGGPAVMAFGDAHPELPIEVAPPLHMLMDRANFFTGVTIAHAIPNTNGAGVLIGVADTGLDVTHPDLIDPATGGTRVAWMIDLSLAPVGLYPELERTFGYYKDGVLTSGAVFAADDINRLLADKRPTPSDEVGHGTHVTSIAAGNGGAKPRTPYVGVAPNATILFARVTRQITEGIDNDDLVRGVQFLFDRADAMKKPVVVNLSLGSDFGPHDGTFLWEQVLASYVGPDKPGHALIAAAGNSGSIVESPVHQSVAVTGGSALSVPISTHGAEGGALEIWVSMREGSNIKVGLDGPDGEWIAPVAEGKEQGKNTKEYNAGVINGSAVKNSPVPAGSHGAVVVISGTWPSGRYAVTLEGEGTADLYLQGVGDVGLSGAHAASFVGGVREGTINLPGTHPSIIAVGCTVNRPRWVSIDKVTEAQAVPVLDEPGGMPQYEPEDKKRLLTRGVEEGEACWFSSAGPTVTGVPKPEISAPGGIVVAAMSKQAAPGNFGSIFTTQCPSKGGVPGGLNCLQVDATHGVSQGTSMSAPMVAGAVALLLERDPTLTQDRILGLLQAGAHPLRGPAPFDDQTGPGELDVLGSLDALEQMSSGRAYLPSVAKSWITVSASYVAADGSTPITAIVELRTDDGEHRADLFDTTRLQPVLKLNGATIEPPVMVRRAPGVWFFTVKPKAGLGGGSMTFGATFDGEDIVAPKTVPIAADIWRAGYGIDAQGGCAVGPASTRAGASGPAGALGAAIAGLVFLRRRRTRARA